MAGPHGGWDAQHVRPPGGGAADAHRDEVLVPFERDADEPALPARVRVAVEDARPDLLDEAARAHAFHHHAAHLDVGRGEHVPSRDGLRVERDARLHDDASPAQRDGRAPGQGGEAAAAHVDPRGDAQARGQGGEVHAAAQVELRHRVEPVGERGEVHAVAQREVPVADRAPGGPGGEGVRADRVEEVHVEALGQGAQGAAAAEAERAHPQVLGERVEEGAVVEDEPVLHPQRRGDAPQGQVTGDELVAGEVLGQLREGGAADVEPGAGEVRGELVEVGAARQVESAVHDERFPDVSGEDERAGLGGRERGRGGPGGHVSPPPVGWPRDCTPAASRRGRRRAAG